jgi:hypothetical protein
MTAPRLIQEIEAAGGVLALKGDRITYDIPKAALALVDVLREHRDEVVQVLRGRREADKQEMSRWMATRCAVPRNSAEVWGSEKPLYRDYCAWCQHNRKAAISAEQFGAILSESFERELDGWKGLCLAVDFGAGKEVGSKPMYPLPLATEVLQ